MLKCLFLRQHRSLVLFTCTMRETEDVQCVWLACKLKVTVYFLLRIYILIWHKKKHARYIVFFFKSRVNLWTPINTAIWQIKFRGMKNYFDIIPEQNFSQMINKFWKFPPCSSWRLQCNPDASFFLSSVSFSEHFQ